MSQPDEEATSNQRRPSGGKDTHFRQTECQYSDSTSSPATLGLMDVLHQIPTLPELLDSDAQKALSATCRSLRECFIFRVQVVTVTSKEDCRLVANRMWPHLMIVILQDKEGSYGVASPDHRRLADICVSADGGNDKATIIVLRPLHMLTNSPCVPLATQQLAPQMKTKWLGMNSFCVGPMGLSRVGTRELDAFGTELVSQLIKGTWTSLQNLSLSGCNLKAHGFWLLSQGNWPCLRSLDISCNCLDAEGMALLAKGNWPRLRTIKLGHNGTLSANGVACLSAANWPVEILMMDNMPFNAHMAAELVDLQLSLTSLYLDGTDLTAAAVTELARADWPGLTFFSLNHNDLNAVCVLLGLDLQKIPLHRQYDAHGFRKVSR